MAAERGERSLPGIDRLSIRARPTGPPLMYQSWGKLLFLHWPVSAALLRPLVPPRLEIDECEGSAWVSLSPFTMWGVRPVLLPPFPLLSRSHELNVRTYVHAGGVPGVWFLSLDASNPLAVLGARFGFHLPYYQARMKLEARGETVRFFSRRTHHDAPRAELDASWSLGESVPRAQPGSLDFFLVERYCLYAARGGRLYRSRIHHRPWPLRRATLRSLASTMLESHGLPTPTEEPLLHAQGEPLHVGIWPLKEV